MDDRQFGAGARRGAEQLPFFAPPAGEFGSSAHAAAPGPLAPRFGGPQTVPPPPAAWPPAPGGPAPVTLEPVAGLGTAATALAGVVAGAVLLTGLVTVAADRSPVAALLSGLGSVATFGLVVANWVVVALWLGRARRNAVRLAPSALHRRHPAWAWFGWFVPVALLFVPYQLVQDVWTACRDRARTVPVPHLRAWWASWLLGLGAFNASSRLPDDAPATTLGALLVLSGVLLAGAAVAFAGVLRAVAAAQAVSPR